MKKEIKAVLQAVAILFALMLASCGDSGEMTLSQLESENADEAFEADNKSEIEAGPPSQNAQDQAAGVSKPDTVIVVYICGSVQNPGVYELPAGSRVCDGLEAAGGFTEEADQRRINLAGTLSDGDMVYFPEEGESIPEGASDYVTNADGNSSRPLVNINTAGEEALCTLPGIGSSKAQAIIKYRDEHGGFKDVQDIMNVNGIGENLYSQIKDLICV